MHVMALTFLFLVALVGTVAIFVFWVVVTILRGITRLILGPPPMRSLPRQPPPQMPIGNVRPCGRISCRALNPVEARFCRRCGQSLAQPESVHVRRAAMF
jgi:hypothetical protein